MGVSKPFNLWEHGYIDHVNIWSLDYQWRASLIPQPVNVLENMAAYLIEDCVAIRVDIACLYKEEYATIHCFVSYSYFG